MTPDDLTGPQWGMLCLLSGVPTMGHDAPGGQAVLRALERRGLAEYRGSRATPRIARWYATAAGLALVAEPAVYPSERKAA